jgi:hypothetical protein
MFGLSATLPFYSPLALHPMYVGHSNLACVLHPRSPSHARTIVIAPPSSHVNLPTMSGSRQPRPYLDPSCFRLHAYRSHIVHSNLTYVLLPVIRLCANTMRVATQNRALMAMGRRSYRITKEGNADTPAHSLTTSRGGNPCLTCRLGNPHRAVEERDHRGACLTDVSQRTRRHFPSPSAQSEHQI